MTSCSAGAAAPSAAVPEAAPGAGGSAVATLPSAAPEAGGRRSFCRLRRRRFDGRLPWGWRFRGLRLGLRRLARGRNMLRRLANLSKVGPVEKNCGDADDEGEENGKRY